MLSAGKFAAAALVVATTLFIGGSADAHQSGCHRWHSCPSDTGSYVCGDLGYDSQCSSGGFGGGGDDESDYVPPSEYGDYGSGDDESALIDPADAQRDAERAQAIVRKLDWQFAAAQRRLSKSYVALSAAENKAATSLASLPGARHAARKAGRMYERVERVALRDAEHARAEVASKRFDYRKRKSEWNSARLSGWLAAALVLLAAASQALLRDQKGSPGVKPIAEPGVRSAVGWCTGFTLLVAFAGFGACLSAQIGPRQIAAAAIGTLAIVLAAGRLLVSAREGDESENERAPRDPKPVALTCALFGVLLVAGGAMYDKPAAPNLDPQSLKLASLNKASIHLASSRTKSLFDRAERVKVRVAALEARQESAASTIRSSRRSIRTLEPRVSQLSARKAVWEDRANEAGILAYGDD